MSRINKVLLAIILLCSCAPLFAQDQKPLTNQEFVKLLYQLPRSPETRDDLIEQIRRRGIGFPLTDGMRGLVATKSGNDPLLRRTLEEAGAAYGQIVERVRARAPEATIEGVLP